MVASQNTRVDFTIPATSYHNLAVYGKLMVGDKAVEFYNDKNIQDYIQIPWEEIREVSVSLMPGGKKVARFAIFINENAHFSFSTRNNKKTLQAINKHLARDKFSVSPTFLGVVKAGLQGIWQKIRGKK